MENNSTLERLNGQINALITAVQEAREENARLTDELSACQAITRQREDTVHDLEESVGLKDMELEDLAMRIEGVLGTTSTNTGTETSAAATGQSSDQSSSNHSAAQSSSAEAAMA